MSIVLVPDLDDLLAESTRPPRLLTRLLARAESRPLDAAHFQSELVLGRSVAPAALTRRLDSPSDAGGAWLRADPVHLVPDLNAVWLRPGARLDPAHPVVAELAGIAREAGLEFSLPNPDRGYLRLSRSPESRFQPPWLLAGESLDHVEPAGSDSRYWRRLLSEFQVMLHQHSDEAEPGFPTGIWLWGAGSLPAQTPGSARVERITATDPVLRALAEWLGLECSSPTDARSPEARTLFEWQAEVGRSADDNLEALAGWLRPLWRRLRTGRLDQLELASRTRAWRLTPLAAWRFWQRRVDRDQ